MTRNGNKTSSKRRTRPRIQSASDICKLFSTEKKRISSVHKAPIFRNLFSERGFTLIELMTVVLLIGILVAISIPVFNSAERLARRNTCNYNQRSIESALMLWSIQYPMKSFVTESCLPGDGEAFIDIDGNTAGDSGRSLSGYFKGKGPFDCSSNGIGYGALAGKYDYITDGRSVACLTDNQIGLKSDGTPFMHDRPRDADWDHLRRKSEHEDEMKTPLGNTFEEIINAMKKLIEDFYNEHGRYPRNWGEFAFTDIGLDPNDWANPIDHIIYTPNGSRISIRPEDGYVFKVIDRNGNERVLTNRHNWSIWYDMETKNWYFHRIAPGLEIDIETLIVERA